MQYLLAVCISAVVLILFIVCYHKIFAVTFDEDFARATGIHAGRYNNMLIALLTAITIVLGMRMMGALLISALVIFPALTSMRVCKRFHSVVVTSALISVFFFFIGLTVSYLFATPTGASVVVINIICFMVFSLIGFIKNRG